MNESSELAPLLNQWRLLTEGEAGAITGNDWPGLAEQQDRKRRLREQISSFLAAADSASTSLRPLRDPGLKARLAELLTLEARNRDALQAKRHEQKNKLDGVAQTVRRLQGLRRAYASHSPPHWNSYS